MQEGVKTGNETEEDANHREKGQETKRSGTHLSEQRTVNDLYDPPVGQDVPVRDRCVDASDRDPSSRSGERGACLGGELLSGEGEGDLLKDEVGVEEGREVVRGVRHCGGDDSGRRKEEGEVWCQK